MVLQHSNCGIGSRKITPDLDIRENKNSECLKTWAEMSYPIRVYTIRKKSSTGISTPKLNG